MEQAIDWNAATPMIQDTITLCRKLGIRYVWIDALCIIQGDLADWERESAKMYGIYYNAHLTIYPTVSGSCLEGFLNRPAPGLEIPFRLVN